MLAIAAFLAGSFTAGKLHSRFSHHRGHILSYSALLKIFLVGIAFLTILVSSKPVPADFSYGLIISLALSMGIQNAVARRLAVPDLTTTVLTLTITGIGADSHLTGGTCSKTGRRLLSILSMFLGALVGALVVLYISIVYPLAIALIIVILITVLALRLSRGSPQWVKA